MHEDFFRLDAYSQGCCLVTELCTTRMTPWAVAHQAPLSMRDFTGKNSGVPLPSTPLVLIEILYDYSLSPLLVYQLYFVYFWLHHVLVAACGVFHCGTWASLELQSTSSRVSGPSSCAVRVQLPRGMWNAVPWPQVEPTSPVLEGGFLSTGPQGSSTTSKFIPCWS